MKHLIITIIILISALPLFSQNQFATISGKILDEKNAPLPFATISIKGINKGTKTDEQGKYNITVPANKLITIQYSHISYQPKTITRKLEPNEKINLTITLTNNAIKIKEVTKYDNKKRYEAGSTSLNPKEIEYMPSVIGGIESGIKILVGSQNELTSQYNVRGGNYDENLVYINDFEVYRPFLVRSGQQEGLSIINPDLVKGVNFSTGGFQSKYGDKMSSVLDITYKRPKEFGGSVTASLLGLGAHLEGVGIKNRFTYLIGIRQKSNQYLLQSQQTKGIYNPTFTDFQTYLSYQFSPQWQADIFLNYARNRFDFVPQTSTQSFGLINKAFQLKMYYNGAETDKFDSRFGGISLTHYNNKKTTLKFLASGFQTNETETYDIQGEYLLGELETDLGKDNFGQIKYALGTGLVHNYARNYLTVNVANIGHKGSYDAKKHFLQWGVNTELVSINDKLNEWERRDSAGFSQPYSDSLLLMHKNYKSSASFNYQRYTAFIQDNVAFDSIGIILTGGVRFNYNQLNSELLISPRLQFSYKPVHSERNIIYRGAIGMYSQPPFYREMRNLEGEVNKKIKAQKSLHAVLGFDYQFEAFNKRPFKFTTELYYKKMWDIVPYEIDNVRIRYFGKNDARAYAYGIETRLYGDIVKDAESWVSVGIMKTEEDILDDKITYKNTLGNDSATLYPSYIPRPTDARFNLGLFFSDYLPRNKNFKLHLNGLYSTGLPFGPPDHNRYGDTLRIPSYKRVDIGFSALILSGDKNERPRYSIFKNLKSMWLSLEVFNLLGIRNTLSYLWIQDQSSGRTYAVPNRLTSRLLNLKLITKF